MLVLALTAAAGAQDESYPDGVVAIVEGEPITRYELELSCRLNDTYRALTPGSTRREKLRRAELTDLIKRRILGQKAKAESIKFTKNDDKRLRVELSGQARKFGGPEALKRTLERIGVPYAYFVARQKANILVSKLLVKTISREIYVSPSEIRAYYRRNKAR